MAKGKLAIGAAVAAVAGFVTGVLLAPKSGQETRQDVKDKATKAKATATRKGNELKAKAEDVAADVKTKVTEVADDVVEKATELKGRAEKTVASAKKDLSKKSKTVKKK